MASKLKLTENDRQTAALKLRDRPYWQLIVASIVLGVLTALDIVIPDPFFLVDEGILAVLSGVVNIALFRKVLRDLGISSPEK